MRTGKARRGGWITFLVSGLMMVACCLPLTASPTNTVPTNAAPSPAAAQLPSTDGLMESLLARLPAKPILVTGDLITTPADGPKSKLGITILLCYPRLARYTIVDAFGEQIEQLTVTREGGKTSLAYEQGAASAPAPVPALGERIRDTALSWMDLTLGFLWWQGGTIIGREEIRGQSCYVLDRRAPNEAAMSYTSVRMWVDTRVSMLLQAEGYDKLGECVRRLSVKSFKKINDEWMIKDLEVEDTPARSKTVLRVRNVESVETLNETAR
jgi:hypothetical protein